MSGMKTFMPEFLAKGASERTKICSVVVVRCLLHESSLHESCLLNTKTIVLIMRDDVNDYSKMFVLS